MHTDAPAERMDPGEPLAGVVPVVRKVAAQGLLFRQGDSTIGVFRLLRGQLRLVRTTPDGARVTIHSVRAGELFAEASLFSDRYHCDAEATEPATVLLYPKAALVARLREDPAALWQFAAELARHLQGLRSGLEMRQTRSAPQRLLQFLHLRSDPSGEVRLTGPLKELAAEIGLTHEALYRALARLERDGSLDRKPGSLHLRPAKTRSRR